MVGGSPPNGTVTVTTTITDPDGTPGTGDETATDASFSVDYNNLTWTAGASGTIDYRQESIATAPPTAANNGLLINALVGGVFQRAVPLRAGHGDRHRTRGDHADRTPGRSIPRHPAGG